MEEKQTSNRMIVGIIVVIIIFVAICLVVGIISNPLSNPFVGTWHEMYSDCKMTLYKDNSGIINLGSGYEPVEWHSQDGVLSVVISRNNRSYVLIGEHNQTGQIFTMTLPDGITVTAERQMKWTNNEGKEIIWMEKLVKK